MAAGISENSVEALKGPIMEALGKLAGDTRVEAEGRRQKPAASRTSLTRRAGPGRPR